MIRKQDFYHGTILNMSGVMASPQVTNQCRWLQRHNADEIRQLWDFANATIITPAECIARAEKLVAIANRYKDVDAVWVRSMKSAPFMYAYVEDAFLSAGYRVVIPCEEYNGNKKAKYAFTQKGWWVIEPFEDE